ncbi:hypothetical protein AB0J71_15610 [Nonomuraea sp. NPDC049637]|uniref:hypothetical protein n=1 Tax=Nonomuraea sp. NPDC049637 TaxID=3154356 RepID=UPI00344949E6
MAIRAATGIESLVWLTDIAGYTRQQAADTMCSSARALLAAALDRHDRHDRPDRRAGGRA